MDKKLQKGIVAVLIANLVNVAFSLATNFLLPKYLSIESYAGIKEFQLYVSYVGLFHLGFVDGIYLKYGGKTLGKDVDKEFSTDLSTMCIFQTVTTIAVLIVAIILRDRILAFFAISILPQNMSNYFKFLYQATVIIGEGFNFNVAAFQKSNRILAGKLKTYFYRRDNPTSAMTKFSIKKCECGLKALDIIKENLQIHTDRVQTAWEFADWRTHSDFYDAMVLAKVKNEYPEFYRKCLNVTKQRALVALKVPTTRSNKIRAILMRVCPAIIPFMLKIREKRHNVNISHR